MTTSNASTSETRTSFENETERHLMAFWHESAEPSALRPMPSVIVMASELLAREHGDEASWARFEMSTFFERLAEQSFGFCSASQGERYHGTLVAFLAFLVREGVVDEEVLERAQRTPLPPAYRSPSFEVIAPMQEDDVAA